MSGRDEASDAVQRALLASAGPRAADELAQAQARVAWAEVVEDAGLERGPFHSRLSRVLAGTAQVEASDAMLANELTLRSEALAWAVNARMRGRPGATIVLSRVVVSVGRGGG